MTFLLVNTNFPGGPHHNQLIAYTSTYQNTATVFSLFTDLVWKTLGVWFSELALCILCLCDRTTLFIESIFCSKINLQC